jgi:hypothetical protein
VGRIWRSNLTAYRSPANQRRRALPRCVRIKRREEARCCSNRHCAICTVEGKNGTGSLSAMMLASAANRALTRASAVDQNADIGPNAIGQVAHGDLLIGAMKPREIGLRHDERV